MKKEMKNLVVFGVCVAVATLVYKCTIDSVVYPTPNVGQCFMFKDGKYVWRVKSVGTQSILAERVVYGAQTEATIVTLDNLKGIKLVGCFSEFDEVDAFRKDNSK